MSAPRYRDLPVIPELGLPHAWDVFGAGDELGTLNWLTPQRVRAAAAEIRTGERVGLNLPLTSPDPALYRRHVLTHEIYPKARNLWDDRIDGLYPQGSTQWDGFRHVRAREFGFYGGELSDPPEMGSRLGIGRWAERGIVGRGVLIDVDRYLTDSQPLTDRAIDADELRAAADSQGVQVRPGDILCLRFGWLAAYDGLDDGTKQRFADDSAGMHFTGLRSSDAVAELLWDWNVAAVVSDSPGVEVSPPRPGEGSIHRRLIPLLGMPLGELFDLDELSRRLSDEGRSSFFFSAVPLRLPGGVGSPANAVAVL